MNEPTADQGDRTRFREEFHTNFAVSANAGSDRKSVV